MFQSSLVVFEVSRSIIPHSFLTVSIVEIFNISVLLNQVICRSRRLTLRCDGIFWRSNVIAVTIWFFHKGIVVVIEGWIFCQCLVRILNQTDVALESSFDALISSRGFSFQDGPGWWSLTTCIIWTPDSCALCIASGIMVLVQLFVFKLQQRYKCPRLEEFAYCVGTAVVWATS